MDNLRLTVVQSDLSWENEPSNFNHFYKILKSNNLGDIVVLPEMFSTGFSMKPKDLVHFSNGEALKWMQQMAKEFKTALVGSAIFWEGNKAFNRLYFVKPNGEFSFYNKRHLFTLAGEQEQYTAGEELLIVEYKDWRIQPFICYDLRFPAWCRNTQNVDLQIFVANWPERRVFAWDTLLKGRAIENMCYIAASNRVGADGNGVYHSGSSVVLNELGQTLLSFESGKTELKTIEISKETLLKSRKRFQFLADADSFKLT